MQTSHIWAATNTGMLTAGSENPAGTFYASSYNISTNRVTCTICHDPHLDMVTVPKLLRAATAGDVICKQCHLPYAQNLANGLMSHPMVASYAAFSADPRFVAATADGNGRLSTNVTNGDIRLIAGGISCTTCHGTHYTDSSAVTLDTKGNYLANTLAGGDGNLLRADGPLRKNGAVRDGATGTAQLRSNLCQVCHVYKMHGKGASQQTIGCLDCHGGHSYNNGTPSAYVLASRSPDAVPVRANRAPGGTAIVTYPVYTAGASSRTTWADNVLGTATGYCEKCHGDVQALTAASDQHAVGIVGECSECHRHNEAVYSFANDASAATCGQCHGFPPYRNISGYRAAVGDANDGGYADNKVDAPNYNYSTSAYFKNETQTAHKTHAGAKLADNALPVISGGGGNEWYFVGDSGIKNCQPCHGDLAGTNAGGHRIQPTTNINTFRDVGFDPVATAQGKLTPLYTTGTGVCTNVYCHSNGGKRNATGTKVLADYTATATPAWVGLGTNYGAGGYGSIFKQAAATRCVACHGNTIATMGAGQKNGSQVHNAHLGGRSMALTFGCEVCHAGTAASATTLAPNATNGSITPLVTGKHVNGLVDIDYKTTGTALNVALATNAVGTNYTPAAGTCSIYCHDPADTGKTADWDSLGQLACDSCHGGLATDTVKISSGSHTVHVTSANGPKIACSKCHGTNADIGKNTGHVDGSTTNAASLVAGICASCHAVDGTETVPVWGNPGTSTCASCHSGTATTAAGMMSTAAAPTLPNFATTGHGKVSGTYNVTGRNAANKACLNCHATSSATHYDNIAGNDKVLIGGFDCTTTCHNGTAAVLVKTHSNTDPTYTGQKRADFTKLCLACHNPHGTTNLAMISPTETDFAGTVVFSAFGNAVPVNNDNSFDELETVAASVNNDEICATCHTATLHNNRTVTGTHKEGQNCLTCHSHNSAVGGFMPAGGTACNDCHGFPPATGAHRKGTLITDPELHSKTTLNTTAEDRTDCATCHTGANLFTYDPAADQAAGGARGNHNMGQAARRAVLAAAIGYETVNFSCTTACHKSTLSDGAWTDVTGLNCNACHYYAAAPTSAGNVTASNSELVSAQSHNKHFDKAAITCATCHTVDNGGAALRGPLTHINDVTGGTEALIYQGMANAVLGEGAVVRTNMTYTPVAHTCANSGGGLALGCHATGAPDWDLPIPAGAAGCTSCHTDTTTVAVNPTSSLHSVVPTVTGKQHSTGFTYNAGANTADCTTCHSTQPTITATDHINGIFNATINADAALSGGQKITLVAALTYVDAVVPTCNVSTAGCHTAKAAPQARNWLYKWHNNAAATNGSQCDGCHGSWSGWNTGVVAHRSLSESETVHGTGINKCRDCHGLDSASGYPFTNTTNDWKPTEAGTTLHGDSVIQVNTAGTTGYTRGVTYGGCTGCHSATDGEAAGQHAFTKTAWTLSTLATTDAITTSCSSCHGGATVGVSQSNYWPDGANTLGDNATADNSGEHAVHIQKLALKLYNETITGAADNDILRNATTLNPGLTSDAKQKEICSYCHTTPGADGDHGITYPADVNTMYTIWNKTLDNGVLTPATGSCATTDCHNNVTTAAGYYWYAGGTTACAMCHSNGAGDITHVAHTGGGYGRTITCTDCHGAGTTATTAPTLYHINGTFKGDGGTVMDGTIKTYSGFTYPGTKGTCGTNACHNDGTLALGAPYNSGAGSYTWGTPLTNCTACHNNPGATGNGGARHTKHMAAKVTTYVPGGCTDCHPAGTAATHINGAINATGTKQTLYTSANGTCTNTCHTATVANGVWTDALALPCVNCHAGTYIGGGANNATSGLHTITPSVTAKIHNETLVGGCAACHTTLAAQTTTHVNGTLEGGNGQKTQMGLPAWYTQTADNTGTCASTLCHLGTPTGTASGSDTWAHVWTNTASYYTNATTACGGCHGLWSNWAAGVTAHRTGSEADTVHGTGATYRCRDCHGLESAAGYPFTFSSNDWKPTEAGTTLHGDGIIQVNTAGTTGYTRGVTYGGCTGCHSATDGAIATQHAFTKTTWTLATTATTDAIVTSCSSCHGGTTVGVSQSNYWPDGANTLGDNATADNSGEHAVHIQKLALKLYNETITGAADNDILRNATTLNPGLTSDAKQKEICSYCHTTPGADGDHGVTYPADVNTMYTIWNKTLDNGVLTPATGSCATTDCHNNVTTAAGYYWYAGGTTACAMCHTSGAGDITHVAHTGGGYGRTITCTDCHGAGTTATTAPTLYHINGTFKGDGGTVMDGTIKTYSGFTYPGTKGTCGTNACHNDGTLALGTPYNSGAGSYTWGTPLTNCTACHNNPGATGNGGARHTKHMAAKVTTYVPGGCTDCHPAGTAATHINGAINATGTKQTLYTSGNGTCTNTCHTATVANGVWTDALALPCLNCHTGTYIGGGANAATSGLHNITPSVSGKIHNDTLNGSGCAACHTTLAAQTTTHVNGTLEGGNGQKTQMGLPAWYTQTADNTGTCAATLCHLGGATGSDNWAHVWTNTASYYTTSPASCGGCHGSYGGWAAGVKHTEFPARGNTQHTTTGTLTYACTDCHAIGASNGVYKFTFGTNDWKAVEAGTTQHGDSLITMNSASTTWARSGTRSGCAGCHEGATGTANSHDFPAATGWTSATLAGDALTGGACDSCHGYPPVQQLAGAAATPYLYKKVEDYNGGARAHVITAHLNPTGLDPTDLWTPCAPCHLQGDHNTAYGVANLVTGRAVSANWGNEATRYPRVNVNATYDRAGTASYTMGATDTSTGMGNCTNVSCHFGESPKWDCQPAVKTNDPN